LLFAELDGEGQANVAEADYCDGGHFEILITNVNFQSEGRADLFDLGRQPRDFSRRALLRRWRFVQLLACTVLVAALR
jgi:hypothetical protein